MVRPRELGRASYGRIGTPLEPSRSTAVLIDRRRARTGRRISVQVVYENPVRGEYTNLFSNFLFTNGALPDPRDRSVDRAEHPTLESTALECRYRVARRRAALRLPLSSPNRADAGSAKTRFNLDESPIDDDELTRQIGPMHG
jgi:hypothetical protein